MTRKGLTSYMMETVSFLLRSLIAYSKVKFSKNRGSEDMVAEKATHKRITTLTCFRSFPRNVCDKKDTA